MNLSDFSLAETIAATLVGLVVTALVTYAARRLWLKLRGWHAALRNISEDHALKTARRTIGPEVLDAIPFMDATLEN